MKKGSLIDVYERLCEMTDLQLQVARAVRYSQWQSDQLEEQALISGAMPGDFKIMLRFQRHGFSHRLTPELR